MKQLLATVLLGICAPAFSQVVALAYHHVTDDFPPGPTVVSLQQFKDQMEYLRSNGYGTITASELRELVSRKRAIPDKMVLITFDDGWKNQLEAAKILKQNKQKATFYIVTSFFDDSRYVSEEETRRLADDPLFEIGAHSHTHMLEFEHSLEKTPLMHLVGETYMSKTLLEKVIRKPVTSVAWPFGYYTSDLLQYAESIGFRTALTVEAASRVTDKTSLMSIPRLNIPGTCSLDSFIQAVRTGEQGDCK